QADGKVTKLAFEVVQPGAETHTLVPGFVAQALEQLPVPKRMRWGSSRNEFVRPVHWAVLLYGDEVIEAEILGVHTGRQTRGHRFLHPAPITLEHPADYATCLESQGMVLADFSARRERIRAQVLAEGRKL